MTHLRLAVDVVDGNPLCCGPWGLMPASNGHTTLGNLQVLTVVLSDGESPGNCQPWSRLPMRSVSASWALDLPREIGKLG